LTGYHLPLSASALGGATERLSATALGAPFP